MPEYNPTQIKEELKQLIFKYPDIDDDYLYKII